MEWKACYMSFKYHEFLFECGLRRNAFAEIQTLELLSLKHKDDPLLLIAGLVLLTPQYIYVKICRIPPRMCQV
jgi:hypothetical protein